MFRDDYVLRLIQQLVEALNRMSRRRGDGRLDAALAEGERAWSELFEVPRELADAVDATTLAGLLGHPARIRAAARILLEEGRIHAARGDGLTAAVLFRRALELLLEVRAADPATRDPDDDAMVAELGGLVAPGDLDPRYRDRIDAPARPEWPHRRGTSGPPARTAPGRAWSDPTSPRRPHDLRTNRPARPFAAIAVGGLVAGVLDILSAIVAYAPSGVTPKQVFQSVASGALGKSAAAGGWPTAMLGLGFHFVIAFGAAAVFYLASRRLRFMTAHPVVCGSSTASWCSSSCASSSSRSPRSGGGRSTGPAGRLQLAGPAGHLVLVGLPIALAVRHFAPHPDVSDAARPSTAARAR